MRAVQNCRPNDNVEPGNNEWRYFRAMANHSQALQAVFMLLRDYTDAQPAFQAVKGYRAGTELQEGRGDISPQVLDQGTHNIFCFPNILW